MSTRRTANTALVWFRRDLRLSDNPALRHALKQADRVVTVYIHAPDEESPWNPGAASRWWLHHSLVALDGALGQRGSRLIIRAGDSLDCLRALCRETGAGLVFWNRLYDPAVISRDTMIKQALREDGLDVESFNASLLSEPWELETKNGGPYKVFTPYYRAFRQQTLAQPVTAPRTLRAPRTLPRSLAISELELLPAIRWDDGLAAAWTPGHAGGAARLNEFAQHDIDDYMFARDFPARDGVSALSPHLHFGEVSVRETWHMLDSLKAGVGVDSAVDAYQRQLVWREFAHHLLFHFPDTPQRNFHNVFDAYPWRGNKRLYSAWCRGTTGIPLVDAAMRQLWHTGWMHNRARMNVASFLTKNLRMHWREGARWFWDTLVDADLANNTMGWQWSAGCGADAAPFYRIFNPVRQGERFDPDGGYVRHWLPELAALPDRYLHQPWNAPPSVLAEARVTLGRDYPRPVVDLNESRDRALESYRSLRRTS